MARIVTVPLKDIKPNPYRNLKTYPWIERKVEHLMRSVESVGVWERVLARPAGDKYEMAFGHHLLEACRRLKLKEVPVIVRPLNDEQMVQFMGRENGEDYNTDALVLLNTWAGAEKYLLPSRGDQRPQPVEIARLLGWMRRDSSNNTGTKMDHLANFAASAHALVTGGHLDFKDLRDLTVSSARALTERLHSRIETIEKMTHKPKAERKQAIDTFTKATKTVAEQVRSGNVAVKDIRSKVEQTAMENAQYVKDKPIPDFEIFGRDLANMLRRMLKEDKASEHLALVAKVLPHLTDEDDRGTIRMLQFELGELSVRADGYTKKLIRQKVVGLPQLEKK